MSEPAARYAGPGQSPFSTLPSTPASRWDQASSAGFGFDVGSLRDGSSTAPAGETFVRFGSLSGPSGGMPRHGEVLLADRRRSEGDNFSISRELAMRGSPHRRRSKSTRAGSE